MRQNGRIYYCQSCFYLSHRLDPYTPFGCMNNILSGFWMKKSAGINLFSQVASSETNQLLQVVMVSVNYSYIRYGFFLLFSVVFLLLLLLFLLPNN